MKKIAFITGITGQDGSYLAEFLLKKGYQVHGMVRRSSYIRMDRIQHLYEDPKIINKKLFLHYGNLTDSSVINRLINEIKPTEIYNLGAQSHVLTSFDMPEYTSNVDALGTLRILEAIKNNNINCRFYQASSSEMFGDTGEEKKNEDSPFKPNSPYACAKVYSYWTTKLYRKAYGLHASNGILFNHESPRRGERFVTRKITIAASKIKLGLQDRLYLGNLNAKRDWGYAPDYIECMWLILQQKNPGDYTIATGETHTVREFCTLVFQHLGMNLVWKGKGLKEKGVDKNSGKVLIEVSKKYFRPAEVECLLGDSSRAQKIFGWKPKIKFKELAKVMVEAEYNRLKNKK